MCVFVILEDWGCYNPQPFWVGIISWSCMLTTLPRFPPSVPIFLLPHTSKLNKFKGHFIYALPIELKIAWFWEMMDGNFGQLSMMCHWQFIRCMTRIGTLADPIYLAIRWCMLNCQAATRKESHHCVTSTLQCYNKHIKKHFDIYLIPDYI